MGKAKPAQKKVEGDTLVDDKTQWTSAEEAEVINELTKQRDLGNQAESGWKPSVWTAVVLALSNAFDAKVPKTMKQVKSR